MKNDILVIGELNVDLILNKIQSFPKMGAEILAHEMDLTLGSSSAIFASNISTLGLKTAFLGKIGEDNFGSLVVDSLENKKVDTSLIIKDKNLNTGATIVLNYEEDRAMVTHPGAMEMLTLQDVTKEKLATANHLHISSIFLQPGIKNNLVAILQMAKEAGLTTSMDTQWDPEEKWDIPLNEILPLLDVFIPNEIEICRLTGENDCKNAIDKIQDNANIIAVKRGNKGSMAYANKEIIEKPAYLNKSVVDAIGAGDSYDAGFIYKFINGCSLDQCLDFANLTGALNTTAPGGTGAFENIAKVKQLAHEKYNYKIE